MHLEEYSFDFAAVLSRFLIHYGVEDVFGRNPGVGDALVVAHHPDENIWDAVLRLRGEKSLKKSPCPLQHEVTGGRAG